MNVVYYALDRIRARTAFSGPGRDSGLPILIVPSLTVF